MKRTLVTCHTCGQGKVRLKDHLEETLRFVKSHPGCTTADFPAPGTLTTNAISNRLSDLLILGLVTRTRAGKTYHYTAK